MGSYEYGKAETVAWIRERFKQGQTCLDVGACNGKWAILLKGYLNIDAVEIFEPNIRKYELPSLYRKVFCTDIKDLEYEWYDLIIFGDVIEHMSVENAQKVIDYARGRCTDMIIAVPYLYSQGAEYGNPWERHIQDDLTPEVFDKRYKGFEPLWKNNEYAYYHKL